ncbi:unnamed protein product [Brassica rapa]|uniref:Triosephosphate isomerase, cytosolic n=2 Tax=Brassica TaxID=3705 RepID=A0A078HNT9_BRANA|nr:unnamed protein product [Brassica napus]CAG7865623.1 unnamed protein product [Brassica rapa]CDY40220.1 BnaA09g35020D [Brassica napus]VDC62679.1 unnamed protein product [Brassica rapa]
MFGAEIIERQFPMNGTAEEVKKIVNTLNEAQVPSQDVVEVVVSPPYVFLPLKGGAFTGEMLVNLDIPWVILGHSERRALLNESNEFVGDKVAYALAQEAGSTMDVVAAQTKAIADRVSNWSNVVIAYEPVWAIGTGKVASPAQTQEVSCFLCVYDELRKWLAKNVSDDVAATTHIIYREDPLNGGNFKELGGQADVDGFLVGGASLKLHLYCVLSFVCFSQNH